MIRRLAVLAVAALAVPAGLAASRLAGGDAARRAPAVPLVIDAVPAAVHRLVVTAGERRAEVVRQPGGSWRPGPDTPPGTPVLALEFEDRLLPLPAYRRLAVDATRPEFGLVAPELTLELWGTDGRARRVAFGAASFTGGGFYARHEGHPEVFLVARRTMDDLRSLLEGRRVDTPRPAAETEAVRRAVEARPDQPVESHWLRQAVKAGVEAPGEVP